LKNRLVSIFKNKSLDYTGLFFITFAVVLGGVVRFYPTLLSDFPLNDGGLFYQMTQDVLDNHFSLPVYTSYNGGAIPFSYPPLAFYLMAFLQRVFHLEIIDQLHYIPPLISTFTVIALYFLSKKITGSKEVSIFAAFAYALMPHSYVWLIMGGGITRSFGILFGILAVLFVWDMFHNPRISNLLLSILFCSLTIVSHPEIAWFVLLTSFLIGIWFGRNKKGILFAFLTIVGVLLLTSPWWVQIVQRFGLSTFVNASRTGGFLNLSVILFSFTGESFANILAIIALIGLFGEIARRRYFLLAWLLLISIFSPRSGEWLATIPAAMLFGAGIVNVIIPGLLVAKKAILPENPTLEIIFKEGISKITYSVILIFALFSAMALPYLPDTEIKTLSQYDRQAMEWVSHNIPEDSRFVMLTGTEWHIDYVSEWFPALSKRISTATVQGSEWLPDDQFQKNVDAYGNLQTCGVDDFPCIMNWTDENGAFYSYVYIRNPSSDEEKALVLRANSSTPSDQYELLYENPGVLIYKVVGAS
jgi:hypothetical protein